MRALANVFLLVSLSCGSRPAQSPSETLPPSGAEGPVPAEPGTGPEAPTQATETLAADSPRATMAGNTFIAPAGWTLAVRGPATILSTPEPGSHIALIDVQAKSAEDAVAKGWAAYRPGGKVPPLKVTVDAPDKDGWTRARNFDYQVSPNEKRGVGAAAMFANDTWTVVIYDMDQGVGEKRLAQVALIFGRLLPKGRDKESFAGKKAHPLDAARIAELVKFVEGSQKLLGVPGVSVGIVQDGKIVFAGGFGLRQLGKPQKVDADTRYIVASNTKAMTTLMLAKLVDEKKLGWDTPAQKLLPSFKLGDADTTSRVLVKHLICACTGMPRQDMEWILQFKGVSPEDVLVTLGTMQPTSKFGELFQYSNVMAAAAGFIGGHVAFPKLELGRAYDEAMRTRVFGPLGMKATTFDFKRAQTGNFAAPHSPNVDGKTEVAVNEVNYAVIPVRPAGAAWSTVNDVLRYVQMELAEGKLPSGKAYISRDSLLARRERQVPIGDTAIYGMGLMVDTEYGVPVVHHGGDMIGFHSDMMWLPEHGVGAVVLTNGDPGWLIRGIFRRKLLEVLFDGRPEADADVAASAKAFFDSIAAERKLLTIPADAAEAGKLAARYQHAALGEVAVTRSGDKTSFDFGEWHSEMASKKNPDGTLSFVTIAPGIMGLEFVVGAGPQRTLTLRDAQHEYVFQEAAK